MMHEAPTLRPARSDERQALEGLQRRASLALDEYRDQLLAHPEAIDLPLDQIEAGRVAVAEAGGVLLGFAVVLPRADGGAELDGLFVDPEHWRRGLGARLIEAAAAMAAADGAEVMSVVANPRAEEFYAACGFRLAGRHETRFGPALLMEKALAGAAGLPM